MIQKRSLLVTGANGFIGKSLKRRLAELEFSSCVGAVRSIESANQPGFIEVGDVDAFTRWEQVLEGLDTVIHTAARAHIMQDKALDPLTEYRRVNVEGTLNLARQAVDAGVRRFVFISSIKVNGEQTRNNLPFTEKDRPAPQDAYGISKLEAERGLLALSDESDIEVVIIRPPLVYGPGVKGNFGSMINLVEKGLPLPLGAVNNKRSLVALDNLVDLIITCIDHPSAVNQIFLAGDGEDLSITELLKGLAKASGKVSKLVPVPAGFLMFGAKVLGKKAMAQRLLGSLQVDISKARNLLNWQPPLSVEEGLKRCFSEK
ncbi:SDR family oxidoreductase [Marinobacter sp. 2_MG-2023]|uniref:UDP-glucose 4-epimerase family protein n=1 Tax=Marinobacter sp. 2_MG-2023 TaxID=3062679 RepID=UPI0026E1D890|nr:SDR family oxidoreductase [Marinobacter sp. 2_MG-2023]MDO6443705.1 SDR family oxidoreductase [Marinobacter sp. 2_MG-2023]